MVYAFPNDWARLKDDFQRLFQMSIVDFYDGVPSWLSGHFMIDLCALDDALHRKYGNYEDDRLSMEEFITKEYGPEAAELIRSLI